MPSRHRLAPALLAAALSGCCMKLPSGSDGLADGWIDVPPRFGGGGGKPSGGGAPAPAPAVPVAEKPSPAPEPVPVPPELAEGKPGEPTVPPPAGGPKPGPVTVTDSGLPGTTPSATIPSPIGLPSRPGAFSQPAAEGAPVVPSLGGLATGGSGSSPRLGEPLPASSVGSGNVPTLPGLSTAPVGSSPGGLPLSGPGSPSSPGSGSAPISLAGFGPAGRTNNGGSLGGLSPAEVSEKSPAGISLRLDDRVSAGDPAGGAAVPSLGLFGGGKSGVYSGDSPSAKVPEEKTPAGARSVAPGLSVSATSDEGAASRSPSLPGIPVSERPFALFGSYSTHLPEIAPAQSGRDVALASPRIGSQSSGRTASAPLFGLPSGVDPGQPPANPGQVSLSAEPPVSEVSPRAAAPAIPSAGVRSTGVLAAPGVSPSIPAAASGKSPGKAPDLVARTPSVASAAPVPPAKPSEVSAGQGPDIPTPPADPARRRLQEMREEMRGYELEAQRLRAVLRRVLGLDDAAEVPPAQAGLSDGGE